MTRTTSYDWVQKALVGLLLLLSHRCVADFADMDSIKNSVSDDGAEGTTTTGISFDDVDLHSLSDGELEQICTDRGFELLKDQIDDTTGEALILSHDDYVEAARQCLTIEKDLEQVISEHPEMMQELEEERERMLAEKERLEKELAELQKDSKDKQASSQTAFVPKTSPAEPLPNDPSPEKVKGEGEIEDSATTPLEDKTVESDVEDLDEQIPSPVGSGKDVQADNRSANSTDVTSEAMSVVERRMKEALAALDHLVLDKLPPQVAGVVRTVLSQIQDSAAKTLKLTLRVMRALIGRLNEEIEARQERAAAQAEAAEKEGGVQPA